MLYRGLSVTGSLILPPEAAFYLRRYEGEPMHVDLAPVLSRRSLPQNARLWAGYQRALKHFSSLLPFTKAELHDAIKNGSEVLEDVRLYFPNGEPIGEMRSTRNLPTPRFGDFMEETGARFARGGLDLWPDGDGA